MHLPSVDRIAAVLRALTPICDLAHTPSRACPQRQRCRHCSGRWADLQELAAADVLFRQANLGRCQGNRSGTPTANPPAQSSWAAVTVDPLHNRPVREGEHRGPVITASPRAPAEPSQGRAGAADDSLGRAGPVHRADSPSTITDRSLSAGTARALDRHASGDGHFIMEAGAVTSTPFADRRTERPRLTRPETTRPQPRAP